MTILKAAFGFLHRAGTLPTNPAAGLKGVREPRRLPNPLTVAEVHHLLGHISRRQSRHRERDTAMVLTFWQRGLRVSELARLRWTQFDDTYGKLRGVLLKGGDVVDLALNAGTVAVLRSLRGSTRGRDNDAIFAKDDGSPLSVRTIEALFETWRDELGWTRPLHPHLLRHSFGTEVQELSGDPVVTANLLNHRGLRHVMIYVSITQAKERAVIARLGSTIPTKILAEIQVVPPPANDTTESSCVEGPFSAPGEAA